MFVYINNAVFSKHCLSLPFEHEGMEFSLREAMEDIIT